ncbi:MAG: LysR family transcriptional regulator [Eubacteriales bacterium]
MDNNLNLYYIFYTVANHKNISAAAKELYISQPAISKAISKLEQSLETVLFIRNSRGVTLTPEGQLLYGQVKNAFICIKTGEERIKRMGELGVGSLSIGVSSTLCKYVLLPFLKTFIKDNPHIKITISCQSSTETLKALDNGTLDIGLVGLSNQTKNSEFLAVMDIQDVFVSTENYINNLKIREGLTKSAILENATFMLLNKENLTRKYIDTYLITNQMEISNIIEVNNMDLLIEFAKIDLGIACVIKEFVKEELANRSLRELSFGKAMTKRTVGFVYNSSSSTENTMITKFIEFYKSENNANCNHQ